MSTTLSDIARVRTFGDLLEVMMAEGNVAGAEQMYLQLRAKGLSDEEIDTLPVCVTHETKAGGGAFRIELLKETVH